MILTEANKVINYFGYWKKRSLSKSGNRICGLKRNLPVIYSASTKHEYAPELEVVLKTLAGGVI